MSIADLAHQATLIFTGTVVELAGSTVPVLLPSDKLVVVHIDRGLRVDPVLGDLRGKNITLAAASPKTLRVGQQAVFFTNSWIHGKGIAARELEHVDVNQEQDAIAAVAALPEAHLMDRLRSAELVVAAQVARIGPERIASRDRNAARWAAAELRVQRVLDGQPRQSTTVYFPAATQPLWINAPRFAEGQEGVFILHVPPRTALPSLAILEPGSLVALDPDDFQPDSRLSDVERLVAAVRRERERGVR
jgi:hypothetical protein